MITRRQFLVSSAAASLALPQRLWAGSSLTMGALRIDTLSDGNLALPADFILAGMPEAELADLKKRFNLADGPLTPPCNVTLLRDGTNTVIFDVGAGPDFQPSAGRLSEALDALGVSTEEVTHVVFTHGHPDHLWGVLDDFDEPVFANANHMIGQVEFDYWTDPATPGSIGDARVTFAVGAARRLEAIADRFAFIADGQEILPGIAARMTPGHTPGHMAFELRAGSESVMVMGDALGNHHIAFDRPDWVTGSDQDGPMAAATRVAFLDQIASAQMPLIGFHLPEGGIGRAEGSGGGYRFVPL